MTKSESAFEARMKAVNVLPIRLIDTHDTQQLESRRPSDYVLVSAEGISFAEVKECSNEKRFDFRRIREAQWVYADLITKKKQQYIFYIFNIFQNCWYDIPAEVFLTANRKGIKSMRFDDLADYRAI